MNLAHNLFLLTTNLLQIRNRDHLIQHFIESLNDIFPDHQFSWDSDLESKAMRQIPVCTRNKTYGTILHNKNQRIEDEPYSLLQNAAQMLAVAIEKIEQDHYIADQKLHFQSLVIEKTQELAALNEEYMVMNEELSTGNLKLKESETRYRSISRLSSDFSYSCIFKHGALAVNWITDAFFSISGYNQEELKQHGCWLFAAHPDDKNRIIGVLTNMCAGTSSKDEFRLISKNGAIHFIINRVECFDDQDGHEGKRFFGSVVDITDRKIAEVALQSKVYELARFNNLMIGREIRMIELKKEVNDLLTKMGEAGKYRIEGSTNIH
jgi:PAS domain S-box-containing protein